MKIEVLVDGPGFWRRLSQDIAASEKSVLVQTYSFEGDAAGLGLADALRHAHARDRRVLVDEFAKHRVNNKFLYQPRHLLDRGLWREVRATWRMYRGLARDGIGLRFANPVGWFFTKLPFRNHKKLVIVDDRVAYVGGINFTDHNFGWHDLMLRIENDDLASFLARDFDWSWHGRSQATARSFDGLELHVLGGRLNEVQFDCALDLLAAAREEIFVESPYLAPPFSEALHAASERGVRVVVVTPESNNWPLCADHIAWKAATSKIELRLYPGRMTHMKAMLIDRKRLIVGSTNFELWSYRFQQEFLCIVTDPEVLAQFEERVMRPDVATSRPNAARITPWRGRLADRRFALLDRFVRCLNGVRAVSSSRE
ncbi:MAG: phosphatidylserine/phosphatidylglycerophosphate/cardiolipin synthase family protein [Vicinamibacteria bacterium]|nr:phosphatidylserine/phosphatidylglycerophosphate/cardiolipin synthase family protein [Vicinamibacteria bacterium]